MKNLRIGFLIFCALTLITGVIYPAVVTVIAQGVFSHQANGSLIVKNGKVIGSELIGQQFSSPRYFQSRPSATSPAYNATASSGSNLGPTNPALLDAVKPRVDAAQQTNPSKAVPVDLVTSSASGLDPHISPDSALFQVKRIAQVRNLPETQVLQLVAGATEHRFLGLLGEERVNVLKLNLALDKISGG